MHPPSSVKLKFRHTSIVKQTPKGVTVRKHATYETYREPHCIAYDIANIMKRHSCYITHTLAWKASHVRFYHMRRKSELPILRQSLDAANKKWVSTAFPSRNLILWRILWLTVSPQHWYKKDTVKAAKIGAMHSLVPVNSHSYICYHHYFSAWGNQVLHIAEQFFYAWLFLVQQSI